MGGQLRLAGHSGASLFGQPFTWNIFGTGVGEGSTDKHDGGLYYSVDYEEGIYIGYRCCEMRGYTDGEEWYNANVVYPFGYGLSYTTFDWAVGEPSAAEITEGEDITVDVTVTNTGSVAGKDVVQLYASAPYYEGGIEKAHKVLVGYEKTGMLEPGASETVTLTFSPYDLASYDYRDVNANGFRGYVICDFNTIPQYMIPRQMFYAGGDLDLATLTSSMWTDADTSSNGDAIVLRNAVKNILYAYVNSDAMNAEVIGYEPQVWHGYDHPQRRGRGAAGALERAGDCSHREAQQEGQGGAGCLIEGKPHAAPPKAGRAAF